MSVLPVQHHSPEDHEAALPLRLNPTATNDKGKAYRTGGFEVGR